MGKKRLVSGTRPTGLLHIGHLEGVLKNCVTLQEKYECYPFIADWHSLTTAYDTSQLQKNTLEVAIDWLSAGIDPNKSTLFVQSHVREHAELATLLGMITPVSWLMRCPTYKEQLQNISTNEGPSAGLLQYPILMTTDICIYKAELVPVGADQIPHLEISRELVRRFNQIFKEVLLEPKALLTKTSKLPGTDGRKMSKSYGNTINLSDSSSEVEKKVMSMVTDPGRIRRTDKGNPEVCSVFTYHKTYNTAELSQIGEDCRSATIGCVDCKRNLSHKLIDELTPFWEQRSKWSSKPEEVREVLADGAEKAGKIAKNTMSEIRGAMNLL